MHRRVGANRPADGRFAAWHRLDEGMLHAFLRWQSRRGTVPSVGVKMIRRGRQHPWRVLSKRLLEAREAGVRVDDALRVPRLLERYVMELYGEIREERRRGQDRRAA